MKTPSKQTDCAKWRDEPENTGLYVIWEAGKQLDIMYWPGQDLQVFELPPVGTKYFGPFLLPLSK